jgi:hypothetical protein
MGMGWGWDEDGDRDRDKGKSSLPKKVEGRKQKPDEGSPNPCMLWARREDSMAEGDCKLNWKY